MVYFVLKYYVDKYNIYYAYKPSAFNGRQFLHRSAINFVIVGVVHLQLSMLFFSVVRLGKSGSLGMMGITSLVALKKK